MLSGQNDRSGAGFDQIAHCPGQRLLAGVPTHEKTISMQIFMAHLQHVDGPALEKGPEPRTVQVGDHSHITCRPTLSTRLTTVERETR